MPLDSTQYQALIVLEVGDVGGFIATNVSTLWTLYDSQDDDYLHYLYSKRKAIDLLMGKVREQVNQSGPPESAVRIDLSDKLKALQTMRGNVTAEIGLLEAAAADDAGDDDLATRQPVIGELTTTAPIGPEFCGGVDGNDRAYRGDVYRRSGRTW